VKNLLTLIENVLQMPMAFEVTKSVVKNTKYKGDSNATFN
jgi:hypothetical protein